MNRRFGPLGGWLSFAAGYGDRQRGQHRPFAALEPPRGPKPIIRTPWRFTAVAAVDSFPIHSGYYNLAKINKVAAPKWWIKDGDKPVAEIFAVVPAETQDDRRPVDRKLLSLLLSFQTAVRRSFLPYSIPLSVLDLGLFLFFLGVSRSSSKLFFLFPSPFFLPSLPYYCSSSCWLLSLFVHPMRLLNLAIIAG